MTTDVNATGQTKDLEALLDYLKRTRGFDFTAYKRATLGRRIPKRLAAAGVKTYGEYLDYLEVHPDEFANLFNIVLINVTGFFREMPAWQYLERQVIPRILEAKKAEEPIRVWSAGCASGEEAYTLAMVWAEALGIEEARRRVKIYATDVDGEALSDARIATYAPTAVRGVPPEMLAKYFELVDNQYIFHKDLRRMVIFGRHDLLKDAPISRIDLLVCRNTLMYFNSEAQKSVIERFHFSLADGGFLFLGRAETLLTHGNAFVPVSLEHRIFTKPPPSPKDRISVARPVDRNGAKAGETITPEGLHEAGFQGEPVAQILLDADENIVLVNERARSMFRLGPEDLGRPLRDLEVSYKPVEMRSWIERSRTERRVLSIPDVPWQPPTGERQFLDVLVTPLWDGAGNHLGMKVGFVDVKQYKRLQEELERSKRDLETAYQQLQSANEELQSTNEELETTNEELQSANEELETMNEELQSTTEELEQGNTQFRANIEELKRSNEFLRAVLGGVSTALAVVDREMNVVMWNRGAEDLWGLRADEAEGKPLGSLDIGLRVETLRRPIRACLSGKQDVKPMTVDVVNRRGKSMQVTVTCTRLMGEGPTPDGVILFIG